MEEPEAIIAKEFAPKVVELLRHATTSIDIIVFDWRWYPRVQGSSVSRFNAAILEAAKRGVHVRCLVNNDTVVENLVRGGCEAKRLHSTKMLHTKMLLIDNVKLVLGSHNYTQHAFEMNHEASVFCRLPRVENRFVVYFNSLWGL